MYNKELIERLNLLSKSLINIGITIGDGAVKENSKTIDNKEKWNKITGPESLPKKSEYDWVFVACKRHWDGVYDIPRVAELRYGLWFGLGVDAPLEYKTGITVTHWRPLPGNPENIKGDN